MQTHVHVFLQWWFQYLSEPHILVLVGIAAGVVMLVRAMRVLHHSSQLPAPGTDLYDMVYEGVGAQLNEEIDKHIYND